MVDQDFDFSHLDDEDTKDEESKDEEAKCESEQIDTMSRSETFLSKQTSRDTMYDFDWDEELLDIWAPETDEYA